MALAHFRTALLCALSAVVSMACSDDMSDGNTTRPQGSGASAGSPSGGNGGGSGNGGSGVGGASGAGATNGASGAGGAVGSSGAAGGGAGGTAGGAGGSAGESGSGGTAGSGPGGSAGSGGEAGSAGAGGSAGIPPFQDPGTGPWMPVPDAEKAAQCKLDPALLSTANTRIGAPYAVIRYGKLCHEYVPGGRDAAAEVWSATKSLGAVVVGIAAYETRNIPRTGAKTGGISDMDRADHWLTPSTITFNREAQLAHVLAMVGHNRTLEYSTLAYSYDTVGSVQINRLSDVVNAAIAQDAARLGANIEAFTQKFLFQAIGMTESRWTSGSANKTFAYTWSSTLRDMARLGLLVMHQGVWAGKRVLDQSWTYKMTHPAFEDANTAYGYLTWLNARTGGTGPGGAGTGTGGDPCAPAAVWDRYPHGLSKAANCTFTAPHSCAQEYDIGVWSAQGLGGQFIVGHAGLDMVIVAKNYSGGGGPTGLWQHIRPALVAHDAKYKGNESGFCAAYGANSYAPDLVVEPVQPPN